MNSGEKEFIPLYVYAANASVSDVFFCVKTVINAVLHCFLKIDVL